jgi:DNA-binding response OmpR family regulator
MTVLVVGHRLGSRERGIRDAIERAADDAIFMSSTNALAEVLANETPRCVVVDSQSEVREINRVLRGKAACFGVPLIAMSDQISDRVMLEQHALGADDVVAMHELGGLTRRLAALSTFDPSARTALFQGSCLLAHPDQYRRQVFGRVLRQAGFDVSFAASADEALGVAERSPPKVLVVSDTLPPGGGRRALSRLSEDWVGPMPAVLLTTGRQSGSLSHHQWPVVPEDAPPDDLLFVVNELLRPRELLESRASRRLLYATLCSFRAAGDIEVRMGLTYNVSREGLYVRTFDVPSGKGVAWLELRPPGSTKAVHLRGEIMWTRTLATGARGAAPPGFGVRMLPEQCPPLDNATYIERYDLLLNMVTD